MKTIGNLQKIGDLGVEEASMMNIFQRAIKDKIEPFETSMRGLHRRKPDKRQRKTE